MMEILEYLVSEMLNLEIEGLKAKVAKETEEIAEKLSQRLEEEREKAARQFLKISMGILGFLFAGIGIAFAIDKLTGISGIGFIAMGLLSLIGSFLIKEKV